MLDSERSGRISLVATPAPSDRLDAGGVELGHLDDAGPPRLIASDAAPRAFPDYPQRGGAPLKHLPLVLATYVSDAV